jgi:outer membrane lipoprotein-sorting protein
MNRYNGKLIVKKIVALALASLFFLFSCAGQNNLSAEEQEKYRKAKQRYDAGQRGGP